jgi:bifunctional non-homologous end joining protein LigD
VKSVDLSAYQKKRDFSSSPEPKGGRKKRGKRRIFVVQKHRASHLHYDFRLEMDGALKSWAVPKGPSLNPKDKRLAIQVEDHPYDYKDFEGNIPAGNYGAGDVIVWDRGSYQAADAEGEDSLLKNLKKGAVSVILHGAKLKGEFSLVRLKRPKQWLLIKKRDQFASARDVTRNDASVVSGRRLPDAGKKARPARAAKPA